MWERGIGGVCVGRGTSVMGRGYWWCVWGRILVVWGRGIGGAGEEYWWRVWGGGSVVWGRGNFGDGVCGGRGYIGDDLWGGGGQGDIGDVCDCSEHQWFRSYLTGRIQSVTVDGHLSDPLTVSIGVPHG